MCRYLEQAPEQHVLQQHLPLGVGLLPLPVAGVLRHLAHDEHHDLDLLVICRKVGRITWAVEIGAEGSRRSPGPKDRQGVLSGELHNVRSSVNEMHSSFQASPALINSSNEKPPEHLVNRQKYSCTTFSTSNLCFTASASASTEVRSSPHPSALFRPCLRPSERVPARSVPSKPPPAMLGAVLTGRNGSGRARTVATARNSAAGCGEDRANTNPPR